MITVQHIQLNSKENYIGYRSDNSLIINTEGVISNLNFKNTNLKSFTSTDDYANALSRGIKNGGVSAIIDEIPYIKVFLSKYSADYSMVKTIPSTNGFAFVSIFTSSYIFVRLLKFYCWIISYRFNL